MNACTRMNTGTIDISVLLTISMGAIEKMKKKKKYGGLHLQKLTLNLLSQLLSLHFNPIVFRQIIIEVFDVKSCFFSRDFLHDSVTFNFFLFPDCDLTLLGNF